MSSSRTKTVLTSRNSSRSISTMSTMSTKTAPVKGAKPIRKFHYILKDYSNFGADTPKWTINPRPPTGEIEISENPGPGEYEVKPDFLDTKLPHIIRPKPQQSYSSLTSKLDYNVPPAFPENNKITIGQKTGQSYITKVESPDFIYVPPSFGSNVSTKILEKHDDVKPDLTPGPGHYNPTELKTHVPTVSMVKPQNNQKKVSFSHDVPGPGSYNILPPLPPTGHWTDKYREKPHRKRKNIENRLTPWEKPKAVVLNV
ncbi:hypothetical protein TVAG_427100 [Trichomonas vaginalis G3]|uniref:Uncharacterized protein n=1 Tax=Trichomonas vaginalis (strain ATCC PRA-98 / G3) TaxID=412133 RepID=A2FNP3_TRIV3|nr:hypothetical protein TVAGG3_0417090 [Trichomonas vaginalis G3]EAX93482.1 hypothetical protein TVAG_427100 [Trichomonas vaginalis G3]KAI5535777.1 hypothetical protein TVAGG3_0417090 [Trichomonas vaginalis G3]|eukprot:XP_001306412.1 hypothetical protein [Trichomonas vaginalis G3]